MSQPFPMVPLGRAITYRKEFVQIDDLETYKRCRVQLHAQGVVLRDSVTGAEVKTKQQQVCRAGEFLVAEIDAKVGGFGIVPPNLDGAIVSSHYFLFEIDESILDRRFLGYLVRTPAFRGQVAAQGSTNYAAIRPVHVLAYRVPLPPLEEQRRIVARVEALAAKIEEARALRRQSVEAANALVAAVMRRLFEIELAGEEVLLESVCSRVIDNLHSNPVYAPDGVPCIRSPDVGWGRLHLGTALKTSEEEYRRRTVRGQPSRDDIVLVREGGGTGKAALVQDGQRFSLGQRVMMLRPNTDLVVPRFLLYQLLSPAIYEKQILPLSKGSASPHLNIGALRKFTFQLPPLSEQNRVVAHLDCLQSEVDGLRRLQWETTAELDALLPSVLDRAFKGAL